MVLKNVEREKVYSSFIFRAFQSVTETWMWEKKMKFECVQYIFEEIEEGKKDNRKNVKGKLKSLWGKMLLIFYRLFLCPKRVQSAYRHSIF
jgi:hypothetical protein